MTAISVTIATFNRREMLDKILFSLDEQDIETGKFEVVICDSHSSDGTADMVQAHIGKRSYSIKHVHTKNNLAAKRNIGISNAQHQFVVFLDDDCVPDRSFVRNYIELVNGVNPKDKVIFCGEVRYPDDFIRRSNYYRFRDSRHFGFSAKYRQLATLNYKTIVVMNMCFDKHHFTQSVGGVSEEFIGYGAEDQDLGWRLEKAGFRMLPCPARILHHEATGSISAYASKIRRSSRDGMKTLLRVNPDAAYSITSLRVLDWAFPYRSLPERLIGLAVRIVARTKIYQPLEWFLEMTDGQRWLYIPWAYRLLMGIYYVEGMMSRANSLTSEQAELGWGG